MSEFDTHHVSLELEIDFECGRLMTERCDGESKLQVSAPVVASERCSAHLQEVSAHGGPGIKYWR